MSKLTAKETAERHAQIIHLRLNYEGMTWAQIAERVDLSERACRDAYKKWADEDKLELVGQEAVDVIHAKIGAFARLRDMTMRLAEESMGTGICKECEKGCGHTIQPAVVLGSVRTVAGLHQQEIELRQETGLLPHDLGQVRVQLDIRMVYEAFITVFDKYLKPGTKIKAGDLERAEVELMTVLESGLPSRDKTAAAAADGN